MQLNFQGLKTQKLNIPTHKAKRVDDKNRVICLYLMFTPIVMVIKMSRMANFYIFY